MEEFKQLPLEALPSICRTCLVLCKLYPINDIHLEGIYLKEILSNYASVQVEENSELPQKICKNCIKKCYEIYRFLKNCKEIETFLNDLFKSAAPKCEEIKCEIEIVNETLETDLIQLTAIKEDHDYVNNSKYDDFNTHDKGDNDYEPLKDNTEISNDNIIEIITEKPTPKSKKTRLKVKSSEPPPKRVKLSGPPFVCGLCNLSFDQYIYKRKHCLLAHYRRKNYQCPHCPLAVNGNVRFQQHIRTHTGEKPNVCHICGKSFNQKGALNRHMNTHTKTKRHKCNDCGKAFGRLEFLNDHKRRCHTGEKLLCPYCGKGFTTSHILKTHERKHGVKPDIKIDPNIPFQCNICGKILINEDILNEHIRRHGKQKNYEAKEKNDRTICQHCKVKYDTIYHVRAHQRNSQCSQYINNFICSQCGKLCISKSAFYAHLCMHRDQESGVIYKCETCGEQFDVKLKFKQHVSKHNQKRNHLCKMCFKSFFTNQKLRDHLRTHTGEKPYVCDVCTKAFALKVNLTAHKRIHLDIKPFKCEFCLHDFRDSSTLRKHNKRCHSVPKPN